MTDQSDSIDITQIDEDDLLKQLGQGDWVIALPPNISDLTITVQGRQAWHEIAGKLFVYWVIQGIERRISHGFDPPWDSSGSIRQSKADPLMLLARYQTLRDWAENEYTGNSIATYISGMGLDWETFEKAVSNDIEERTYRILEAHCKPFLAPSDDDEVWENPEWDEIDIIMIFLNAALRDDALQMTTAEAWQRYEAPVRSEIEASRQQAEHHRQMQAWVRQFWEQHFPDIVGNRIEVPQFREMNLEHRITEVLADTDPQIVRLIAELGAPGNYSNRVRVMIKDLACRAASDLY